MMKALQKIAVAIGEPSWIIGCFLLASLITAYLIPQIELTPLGIYIDSTLGQLALNAFVYAMTLILVISPYLLLRKREQLYKILGVNQKPGSYIWWRPLLFWLLYMTATTVTAIALFQIFPWIDQEQKQDVGFQGITTPLEYLLAFVALVILPPVVEELVFRGYLFGRLREQIGLKMSMVITSIAFGFVHMQWNVGIDTFVLSLFLCYLREKTGTIWASMVLHGLKNAVAYFFLFIGPLIGLNLLQ